MLIGESWGKVFHFGGVLAHGVKHRKQQGVGCVCEGGRVGGCVGTWGKG